MGFFSTHVSLTTQFQNSDVAVEPADVTSSAKIQSRSKLTLKRRFISNADLMGKACTDLGLTGYDTTDVEIGDIWNAIQKAAGETGVDHRFILAVMMQESKGCVRVWTTYNGVVNPGLMQSHAGTYSCNEGRQGETWGMQTPCPAGQIEGMIRDGVSGTSAGDGLVGILNRAAAMSGGALDGSSAQLYYQVARAYNSGQVDRTNLNFRFSSTRCYSMDVANRLTGWVYAQSQCTEWQPKTE